MQFGIEVWCNGSTTDFGSACPGSNPGTSTLRGRLCRPLFLYRLTMLGSIIARGKSGHLLESGTEITRRVVTYPIRYLTHRQILFGKQSTGFFHTHLVDIFTYTLSQYLLRLRIQGCSAHSHMHSDGRDVEILARQIFHNVGVELFHEVAVSSPKVSFHSRHSTIIEPYSSIAYHSYENKQYKPHEKRRSIPRWQDLQGKNPRRLAPDAAILEIRHANVIGAFL